MTPDLNILRLLAHMLAVIAKDRQRQMVEAAECGAIIEAARHEGYAEGLRYAADALTETLDHEPVKPDEQAVYDWSNEQWLLTGEGRRYRVNPFRLVDSDSWVSRLPRDVDDDA